MKFGLVVHHDPRLKILYNGIPRKCPNNSGLGNIGQFAQKYREQLPSCNVWYSWGISHHDPCFKSRSSCFRPVGFCLETLSALCHAGSCMEGRWGHRRGGLAVDVEAKKYCTLQKTKMAMEKTPFFIANTSWKGPFAIVTLVFGGYTGFWSRINQGALDKPLSFKGFSGVVANIDYLRNSPLYPQHLQKQR